ncbi:MAG: DUF6519 domain-containing protein [Bacteroidetes bacterium]|nr:DUF6519 domain-containing protein [Bacteroidota bacterium]
MDSFDISRVGFDPAKHYSGIEMQQGRVITDDDINESGRLQNENERRSNLDAFGPAGSPDNGFRITDLDDAKGIIDFHIQPGRLYVGGVRFDMDTIIHNAGKKPVTYKTQKDFLQVHDVKAPNPGDIGDAGRYDLVYFEGWQQSVSATEDGELFEVALGGPDTSTRIKNMTRVSIIPDIGEAECFQAWNKFKKRANDEKIGSVNKENELLRDADLKVTYTQTGTKDNLCSPSVQGGYLGAENQAIRVQLTAHNKLTWGFDNASPLYKVQVTNKDVKFITIPKDQYHWPLAGQVVEILPWSAILPNGEKIAELTGFLSKVDASYNPDDQTIRLHKPPPADYGELWKNRPDHAELNLQDPPEYYYLRVWSRGDDVISAAEIPFTLGDPLALGNTGIEVTITGHQRNKGDYWIIAARPNSPDQVVPWKLEKGAPVFGPRFFLAPLAILEWRKYGEKMVGKVLHDCRKRFRPLTDQKTCCTYMVGDGKMSFGDFNSIEEAINNLPPDGGRVCVLQGDHRANVSVFEKQNIQITGCGERSVVRPHPNLLKNPVFHFDACQHIEISDLSVIALDGTAIHIVDRLNVPVASSGILVKNNKILALEYGIYIRVKEDSPGDNDIKILNNQVGMIDKAGGMHGIFSLADGVLIEGNKIIVVTAPDSNNPEDPRKPDDPGHDIFDPCKGTETLYHVDVRIQKFVKQMFFYINGLHILNSLKQYKAAGGIKVGGSSERVHIINNIIIGGSGNGITLGHLAREDQAMLIDAASDEALQEMIEKGGNNFITSVGTKKRKTNYEKQFKSCLYEIVIRQNQISNMGLSGIGVVAYFNRGKVKLMVCLFDLTIENNHIIKCAQQIPEEIPREFTDEVAYGGVTLAYCVSCIINNNRIEQNGNNEFEPVSGIFILCGDAIEIKNNQILSNGPRVDNSRLTVRKGNRGGIVIRMTFKMARNVVDLKTTPSYDGMPAAMIQGNIVTQPLGHALLMVAMGPVSVTGNIFTSQGVDYTNPYSLLAGSVLIIDLGFSKDIVAKFAMRLKYRELATRMDAELLQNYENVPESDFYSQLQLLPSGSVLFSDNQTFLDLREKSNEMALSSQIITTMDDISFDNNYSEILSWFSLKQRNYDRIVVDAALIGFTVRSNNNRFQEGLTLARWSLLSLGFSNLAIGNQASHCLHIISKNEVPAELRSNLNYILFNQGCKEDQFVLNKTFAMREGGETHDLIEVYQKADEGTVQEGASGNKAKKIRQITLVEGVTKLNDSLDLLEEQRAASFTLVQSLLEDQTNTLHFEVEKLSVKYGQNHALVDSMKNKVASNKEYLKNIKIGLTG